MLVDTIGPLSSRKNDVARISWRKVSQLHQGADCSFSGTRLLEVHFSECAFEQATDALRCKTQAEAASLCCQRRRSTVSMLPPNRASRASCSWRPNPASSLCATPSTSAVSSSLSSMRVRISEASRIICWASRQSRASLVVGAEDGHAVDKQEQISRRAGIKWAICLFILVFSLASFRRLFYSP